MPRLKRESGTIRKRRKRWSSHYMGPDQAQHYAPTTFDIRANSETWLMGERRLQSPWASATKRARRVEPATLEEMAVFIEHLPDRYGALVLIGPGAGYASGK